MSGVSRAGCAGAGDRGSGRGTLPGPRRQQAVTDGRCQGEWLPLPEPPSVVFLPNAGDLESFKKQSFVLKEGVEYRIKISFRVRQRLPGGWEGLGLESPAKPYLGSLSAGEPRDRVWHEVYPAHIQERRQE